MGGSAGGPDLCLMLLKKLPSRSGSRRALPMIVNSSMTFKIKALMGWVTAWSATCSVSANVSGSTSAKIILRQPFHSYSDYPIPVSVINPPLVPNPATLRSMLTFSHIYNK